MRTIAQNLKKVLCIHVCYDDRKREDYYSEICNLGIFKDGLFSTKEYNAEKVLKGNLFVPFCKNKEFKEEKESRLIIYAIERATLKRRGFSYEMKYIERNNLIIPTLLVNFRARNESESIIDRFVVGPGMNQDLVFKSLVHLLTGSVPADGEKSVLAPGSKILIKKSKVPFRG